MKILYFKNDTCSVCKAIFPKIGNIAKQYDVNLEVIDVVKNPEVAGQKLIFTVPTIVFLEKGIELKRFSRNFSILEVQDFIERYNKIMSK
ncbi:glutaredoxin [Thermosipho melanesiensis]|uniref:Glutaredoxin 2 n=2 Tax=Thermosipho melanesiensis TaxID=46541 RepID=A6LNN8_THEM4|nr:thioredoxin family protein [Thermosipho melanesiensis]ABR31539.1 glutaredoxin 2 [Thermosipho melanesiensis BI429]APT74578.1 glutaredoxin [Thermosipho melanesiensis]OOC35283.1 glutaredoxin [Thermosipho melanesiensis]OOC35502.1 glutaredoxin [Thermosipho melanesiensis]OOC36538.1 glutaredoxin [Thermosipho melanesiensis]